MSTQSESFKQNLIGELEDSGSKIDAKFKSNLEHQLMTRYSRNKPNYLNLVVMTSMSKLKYAFAVLALVLVLGGGIVAFPYAKTEYIKRTVNLDELVSKLSDRNQTNNRNTMNATAEDAAGGKMASSMWYGGTKGFYLNKTTYEYGPQSDKCNYLARTYDSNIKYGSDEYYTFSNDEIYYEKSTSRLEDGTLQYFSLTNEEGQYSYVGGSYAVLDTSVQSQITQYLKSYEEYGETVSVSNDEGIQIEEAPVIDDTIIVDEPGYVDPWENSEIIGYEEIDGVEHYLITYSYPDGCSESGGTVVVVSAINPDTYELAKATYYFEEISDENLVVTYKYESESIEDADYESVRSYFEFEFDVEVKEIDRVASSIEALKDSGYDILIPGEKYSPSYIEIPYAKQVATELTMAREYYPNNEYGQKMYEDVIESLTYEDKWALSELNSAFAYYEEIGDGVDFSYADNTNVSLNIYDSSVSDEILIQYLDVVEGYPKDVTISINGEEVAARHYVHAAGEDRSYYEYSDASGAEIDVDASGGAYDIMPVYPGESGPYYVYNYTLIFEYNGLKYEVAHYESSDEPVEITLPSFTTLNLESDFEEIKEMFRLGQPIDSMPILF